MPMKSPVHPGRIVAGSLEDLNLTITEAAKVLGVTRATVSRLVNGHSSISPDMAIRLSKAFGSTPDFWLNLQHNYDLAQTRKRVDEIHVERYQREPA